MHFVSFSEKKVFIFDNCYLNVFSFRDRVFRLNLSNINQSSCEVRFFTFLMLLLMKPWNLFLLGVLLCMMYITVVYYLEGLHLVGLYYMRLFDYELLYPTMSPLYETWADNSSTTTGGRLKIPIVLNKLSLTISCIAQIACLVNKRKNILNMSTYDCIIF